MTKGEGKGFAGLQSLLSEVDPALEESRSGRDVPVPPSPSPAAASPEARANRDPIAAGSHMGTEAPPGNRFAWPFLMVGTIAVGGIVLFANSVRKEETSPTDTTLNQPAPRSESPASPAKLVEVLSVAARNANLRAMPNGRAKIIGTLPRGAMLAVLDESEGFVKCKTATQPEGWVARSILIGQADATRLAAMSADEYVESRKNLQIIEKLLAHVQTLQPEILREQAMSRSPSISDRISEMESRDKPVDTPLDAAAGKWFSLEARALLDSGNEAESSRAARAAVFGDPLNVDYHTALAYAAVKQESKEWIAAESTVLLALAPGSTNTWVIVGVAAAMDDLPPLAAGSLAVAIDRSKSRSTTLKVLKEIATKARDARISAAIEAALDEADKSASNSSAAGVATVGKHGT